MLSCLRVRQFAIIDELEVEFGPGLNVVTGETGAGKSILVRALKLVLGSRGTPDVVRTGADRAVVEALFELRQSTRLVARLQNLGIAVDDQLLLRRVILSSGRSRAYINERMATAAQLREIASGLVDITSQHAHHTLVDPSTHLRFLDAFAGLSSRCQEVTIAHRALTAAMGAVESLRLRMRERVDRESLLQLQIGEIEKVNPQIGEDVDLDLELSRLQNAQRLASVTSQVESEIYARDGALCERLSSILAELEDATRLDTALRPFVDRIEGARVELEEAAQDLGGYSRDVMLDAHRLGHVEERLDAIHRLMRRYGGSLDQVREHHDQAKRELELLEHSEDQFQSLMKDQEEAQSHAQEVALELSSKRRAAASRLSREITAQLASLSMGDAEVRVDVSPLEGGAGELVVAGAKLSPVGIDRVEFLIAPNRGEPPRPLRRVASGGELSRSLLAIKRVLASEDPVGLYVFDEVDTGVGAAVAEVIGRKLHEVSQHHQVLCITHLPQIARFADTHFRVQKAVVGERTQSQIVRLDDAQRLDEIARMLGGLQITEATRAAAEEMLQV